MKSRLGMLIAVTAAAIGSLAASACDNIINPFDPCPETKQQEKVGQLDGTWDLDIEKDITGTHTLPYRPLNLSVVPMLVAGNLAFQTTKAVKGSECTDLITTEGTVVAEYVFKEGSSSSSSPIETDWYTGKFVFDHKSKVLTLRAGKYSRSADVEDDNGDRVIVAALNSADFKTDWGPLPLGTVTLLLTKRPF